MKKNNINIKITIVWYDSRPVAFYFSNKLVWDNHKIIPKPNEYEGIIQTSETSIILPIVEATRLSAIFINGVSADNLRLILLSITNKINELNRCKVSFNTNANANELEDENDDEEWDDEEWYDEDEE